MTRTGQLSPTTARRITLTTDDGPVAALRCGADDRPDVLLLPGYTGSKEDFTPMLDPLSEAGFRVTSLDLPGQFESPGSALPSDYSPDTLAETVCAVARQLGPAVHLVGHSFGGLVARAAVIAHPELFADLVLMSSGPSAIDGMRRQRILDIAPLLPLGLVEVHAAMQAAIEKEQGYVAPPGELAEFLQRRFLSGSSAMLQGMADALCGEPDRVEELAAAGVAMLVIYGEHDDAWQPDVQAEMARRLGAQCVRVPNAAHSPAVENTTDTVGALTKFWTG